MKNAAMRRAVRRAEKTLEALDKNMKRNRELCAWLDNNISNQEHYPALIEQTLEVIEKQRAKRKELVSDIEIYRAV